METVDLFARKEGTIWVRRTTLRSDGLVLKACNTEKGMTAAGKKLSFMKVAFSPLGDVLYTADHMGNIYKFDLARNRYDLCLRTNQVHSALAVSRSRPSEVLAGCPDYHLRCYNTESGELLGSMGEHSSSIKAVSLHPNGRYVLAVTTCNAVLWDLDTFSKCRTLNGGQDVGVQDVLFLPATNTILTCFRDDSIHGWEADTLEYKYHLPVPEGEKPNFRVFAVSHDGHYFVAGGRSPFLYLWTMASRKLLRVVQLPSKVRGVKGLAFLPQTSSRTELLLALCQDGIGRVLDIVSSRLLFQIGSHENMIDSFDVCPTGRYTAAVSQGNLLLYDLHQLSSDLGQPPVPVVAFSEADTPPKAGGARKSGAQLTAVARKKATTGCSKTCGGGPRPDHSATTRSAQVSEEPALDEKRMRNILKGFGEYPEKYRCFIWGCLLKLPENHTAYSTLLDKGTHPVYANLHHQYPIKSRKLLRVMQRVLSALAFWSPVFGEADYLPHLAFPFAKLFQNNRLLAFEMLATILINWCGHWFEYFPNPPLNVLAIVENLLTYHDHKLLEHFVQYGITSQVYAWPLLKTMFSEVLSREEWLRVWDHIISNHPSFLLLLAVAYLTTARQTLLKCTAKEDFEFFFHHRNALDVGKVLTETYHLQQTTPPDLHPERMMEPFLPLTKGSYPVFNKYPKFIVDYQVQERERIRQEETEYLKQRQSALELERMTEQRKQEEAAWYRQQELLLDAETQRRQIIELEEQKLRDQRERLRAMRREAKVAELKVLDDARQRFLQHQKTAKEIELQRLDDEIKRRVLQRDRETREALDEIDVQALEVETQKAAMEQALARKHEEAVHQLRSEGAALLRQEELEAGLVQRGLSDEGEGERRQMREDQLRLAAAQENDRALSAEQKLQLLKETHDIRRELQHQVVSERLQGRQLSEKQLHATIKALQKEERKSAALRGQDVRAAQQQQFGRSEARVKGLKRLAESYDDSSTPETVATPSELSISDVRSTASSTAVPACHAVGSLSSRAQQEDLNHQEVELMSRVRELRQRLVKSTGASLSLDSDLSSSPLLQSATI